MKGFRLMAMFYGSMMAVPAMLWIISISYALPFPYLQMQLLRTVLAALVGIGSIIYGVIGFKEVFAHGK
jgi:hypothetical protein